MPPILDEAVSGRDTAPPSGNPRKESGNADSRALHWTLCCRRRAVSIDAPAPHQSGAFSAAVRPGSMRACMSGVPISRSVA
jgi:hypothetical protein